nr:Chain C, Spike protein S2' peptide VVFLHVTYV [Severe acute respiratory syndrome coronavirus 2]
VVFLHVTYV